MDPVLAFLGILAILLAACVWSILAARDTRQLAVALIVTGVLFGWPFAALGVFLLLKKPANG